MKMIIIILNLIKLQYLYDFNEINITPETNYLYINDIWKENNVNYFQISFYINIYNYENEVNILTFTDFFDFNIEFIIKNNNSIFINNKNTNLNIIDSAFFYFKGEMFNKKIKLTLKINEISNEFIFINEKNYPDFNFSLIKIILGSNKNLINFQFDGKIYCLCSIVNSNISNYDNMKKCNSKILIYHNYRNNIKNTNYFYNEIDNGFTGSINGNSKFVDENDITVIEELLSNNKVITHTYFQAFNNFISLSRDFVIYTSNFNKISYSIYLSLKLHFYFNSSNDNLEFYFYKRNNLIFWNKITNIINNNRFNYEIYSSNMLSIKSGESNNITYFKMILLKIFNKSQNNYLVSYIYKTNKNIWMDYNDIEIEKEENHDFTENDKHYIGVFNANKFKRIPIKFFIYETGLILGSGIYEIDNKLYTKNNNELIVLFCNDDNIKIKNRYENLNLCKNDDEMGIKYLIEFCKFYKNNKCLKCITSKKLINNRCIDQNIITYYDENEINNYKKFYNSFDNDKKLIHSINKDYGFVLKKFLFKFSINIFNEFRTLINIKLKNIIIRRLLIVSNNIINSINVDLELYLKNINLIEIEKVDTHKSITYNWDVFIYDKIDYRKDLRPFENCLYFYNNDYYLPKIENFIFFECVNKNNIPDTYYLNKELNIIYNCIYGCLKCLNNFTCIKCKENYFLLDNTCIENNDKNCEIPLSYNKCKKCKENSNYNILNNSNKNCFSNCYNGCNSCNSPLYNQCLSCKDGFLYYLELKECIFSNDCKLNYKKLKSNQKICISKCMNKDINNICLSCNSILFLNKNLNECIECITEEGFFKNYKVLDNDNKPTCEKCDDDCKTCTNYKNTCTNCKMNKFLILDKYKCVDDCPNNYYYKKENFCLNCNKDCIICNKNNLKCLKCNNNKYIKENNCVINCGNNYYLNNKVCEKCTDNCLKCTKNFECLNCDKNYYLNETNLCIKCNLNNEFIFENKCYKCSDNCKSCYKNKNYCLSCYEGFLLKKIENNSICLKKCDKNFFYDQIKNKCLNCNQCLSCFSNNIINCFNCQKCKNKCKLNLIFNEKGIIINNNLENNGEVDFNLNFKINDYETNNNLIKNGIQFLFKNNKNYDNIKEIKIKINKNILIKSNNCFYLNKYIYFLKKKKLDCKINLIEIINNKNKLFINMITNFYFTNEFIINLKIKEIEREINYKIVKLKIEKNKTNLLLEIFPNHYKNNFNIILNLNKKYIKNISFCNKLNINKILMVYSYKTDNFISDYEIKKNNILVTKNFNIIQNPEKIGKLVKDSISSSSIILTFINIWNSGNIIFLIGLFQLVYIFEFILLIPINLGEYTNSFINYFKLDLDLEVNLNFILNIKDENEIKKFYEDKFLINPKISNINWLNILNFQIDILLIIILNIIHFILYIIKKIFIKKNYNKIIKSFNELNIIDRFMIKIKILKFKLIEAFFPIIFTILIVYLYNINKFKFNWDNIKIFSVLVIYYALIINFFYHLFNAIIFSKNKSKIYGLNFSNKYFYKNLLTFNNNSSYKYILYQLFYIIREIIFIIVIFMLKNLNIHAFIFLIVQSVFVFYLFILNTKEKYFLLQKFRFEEIINLILILSIILNFYFGFNQFQISFIIFYILLFFVNFLILLSRTIKYLYSLIKNINKKFKIL